MRQLLRFLAASALVSVLSVGQANAGVAPPVFIIEDSIPGGLEYTVNIDSFIMNLVLGTPQTTNWYIPWFAVGSSVAAGNTDITNGIGNWNSASLNSFQWDNGFSFEFGTPGGPMELLNTQDFAPDFDDLFGGDLVANAYWAGSYTDFNPTNLIGATELRGGFLYDTSILASEFVIALSDVNGTLGASCTGTANTGGGLNCSLLSTTISEPATVGLFGIGLIGLGLAARRRQQTA